MKTEMYQIPTYFMPFYLEGDDSALTAKEVEMAEAFMDENGIALLVMSTEYMKSAYFHHTNDVIDGMACEVYDILCIHHNDLAMEVMRRAINN